jgi:hypothetical protein
VTLPSATIIRIQRIQNKKLWRRYQNEVDDVASKYGGREHAAELYLYHGSKFTAPETIYKSSEEGFDTRFARAGYWGFAAYFAKNSEYSDSYAFEDKNNKTK